MTQRELLYVKTLAEEGSISAAAQKLYIAQPSLSQALQRIEEGLGIKLFTRQTTGLTLTYGGELYYRMALQILKIYQDFEAEVSDINDMKSGRIHMGITFHLGAMILPYILPAFRKDCPNIELYIKEENSTVLEEMLTEGTLDFALMHMPKDHANPNIQYEYLYSDPFVIVLSPEHPLNRRAVKKPDYPYPVLDIRLLANEPFIMLHKVHRIRQITDSILQQIDLTQPNITLTLKNYATAQLLAAKGVGIALLPLNYVAKNYAPDAQPAILCIDKKYAASWNFCIAVKKNTYTSRVSRYMLELVRKEYGNRT